MKFSFDSAHGLLSAKKRWLQAEIQHSVCPEELLAWQGGLQGVLWQQGSRCMSQCVHVCRGCVWRWVGGISPQGSI